MDGRRFLEVPGRSAVGRDRDDLAVWVRGPVEHHASAVLLIHDRLDNARAWDLVLGRLPGGTAGIAVDLRGRGAAWRQEPSLGLATHVRDIADLLDRLDIDDVLAVGHGFGASVVSQLAEDLPDRVPLTIGILGGRRADPLDAVLGMAFPDREEHVRFWQLHPQFAAADPRAVDAFVHHGIAGPEDHHRWRVDLRSLVADDHSVATATVAATATPPPFTRSILVGPHGSDDVALHSAPSARLESVDPAVVLLSSAGADAVAAQLHPFLR